MVMTVAVNYNKKVRSGTAYNRARRVVLARDDFCYLCGGYVDKTLPRYNPLAPEVDHIVAISVGGDPFDTDNMALSHRVCNNAKSDKSLHTLDKQALKKQVNYIKEDFKASNNNWLED